MTAGCHCCKFWSGVREVGQLPRGHQYVSGKCRRNPPTLLNAYEAWPSTRYDDWCGEFSDINSIKPQRTPPHDHPS
jgi:hypothetical protein